MKKKLYKARWGVAWGPSVASVDFRAASDSRARAAVGKIGRELGVTNYRLSLMCCEFERGSLKVRHVSTGGAPV